MSSSNPPSNPGRLWQPPTAEELQAALPPYEILGLLGRGGMGAVYRARQRSLQREVAIKVLPPAIEDGDMRFAERFKAEAQSMARLNHPGIVAVYDAGETPDGLLFIVMEYVEGTDVAQMLAVSGRLPPDHAHAIAAHVCDALAYAHSNGLIHRDIKPANIMVDVQGRVKVADFGLAKSAHEESGFTQSNMAVGTPDFVAPEAFIPGMPMDGRADLYAVGVMLYQMLTGEIPRGAWPLPSARVPGLDARFDQIVIKAMQTDRESRHSSAAELRHHLDSLLIPAVSAPDLRRYSSTAMAKEVPETKAVITHGTAKSKTPWFIGIGATVVIAVGAFMVFGAKKEDGSAAAPQTEPPLAVVPIKVAAPAKPEPVAKAPERPKVEAPKPAAPAPKKEYPKPVVVAPTEVMPKPEAPAPVVTTPVVSNSPETEAKLPPELAALDAQFINLQAERVTRPFETDVAKLNTGYLGGIAKKIAEEKAAGHLDGILALEAEQQLLAAKQPVPDEDVEKTPASLKGLRTIYRDAYAKLIATRAANLKALTDPLDKRLAQMEADLIKTDRVTDAKVVRGYREVLSESTPDLQIAAASPTPSVTTPPQNGLKPITPLNPAAAFALKDGITNSLGMKFLPVKGTDVLFCIHEVRYSDYAAYAAESPGVDGSWKDQSTDGFTPTDNQGAHPVINVSWEDAQKFCAWLSKKEDKTYRLPTDREWSIAVGIGRDEKWKTDTTPATVIKNQTDFPWGDKWPPPKGIGNFSDASRKAKTPPQKDAQYLENYDDGFPTTAPVMSFKPNKLGLYDLGGNVWEWVEDWYDSAKKDRVLRGGAWQDLERDLLLSSNRNHNLPDLRNRSRGFRCVLVAAATATPVPSSVSLPHAPRISPLNPAATLALKDGITNTLGMKFLPVKGTGVLFCIHEVRYKDYAAYAAEAQGVDGSWKDQTVDGFKPNDRPEDHPVMKVNWEDAQKFCAWLSQKEGKLYRLPTDQEWSDAVGIGRGEKWTKDTTPATVFKPQNEFPWGDKWPLPTGSGNYSDQSRKEKAANATAQYLEGYDDGYPTTAPVMSFKPNKIGLYDLGGNVWEWCEDWYDNAQKERMPRGGSWQDFGRGNLLSSCRYRSTPGTRSNGYGFRLVLVSASAR